MLYLVLYDVRSPRRRWVRRLLEGYGWPVARCAFECPISTAQAGELRSRLEPLLQGEDRLRCYRVCNSCLKASWRRGDPDWAEKPTAWIF